MGNWTRGKKAEERGKKEREPMSVSTRRRRNKEIRPAAYSIKRMELKR